MTTKKTDYQRRREGVWIVQGNNIGEKVWWPTGMEWYLTRQQAQKQAVSDKAAGGGEYRYRAHRYRPVE